MAEKKGSEEAAQKRSLRAKGCQHHTLPAIQRSIFISSSKMNEQDAQGHDDCLHSRNHFFPGNQVGIKNSMRRWKSNPFRKFGHKRAKRTQGPGRASTAGSTQFKSAHWTIPEEQQQQQAVASRQQADCAAIWKCKTLGTF
eukprot:1144760-Pelagomonas_calceolata.AAC.3